MPIFAKNIIIGNQKEEEKSPPPQKPVTDFQKIRIENKVEELPQEHYKHIETGDLHRLFNTKSSYLKDMAALED